MSFHYSLKNLVVNRNTLVFHLYFAAAASKLSAEDKVESVKNTNDMGARGRRGVQLMLVVRVERGDGAVLPEVGRGIIIYTIIWLSKERVTIEA